MKKESTYHHGDLRAALLAHAQGVIEASGDDALSLRACARALGVDVAAVYRHFKSKGDVLAAVAAAGYQALARAMEEAMTEAGRGVETAEACFLACGRAYVAFGMEHAHLYQLMFGGRCSAEAVEAQSRHGEAMGVSPFGLLREALDTLAEAGLIAEGARPGAEFFVWASVHGAVSLLLGGRGSPPEGGPDAMAERCCRTLLRGLGEARA